MIHHQLIIEFVLVPFSNIFLNSFQKIYHYNYTADSYYKIVTISGAITNHTATGAGQSVLVGHRTANGSSDRPFNILNPNASDDLRIENSMGGSSLSIWEMNL